MLIQEDMSLKEKLEILADAAKYDVACTSSGSDRKNDGTGMGNCKPSGICHSFAADGRCISLLKILFTNQCVFDCKYCINRVSNDVVRTSFTPDEVCQLTMGFYRRNYIEGLFLSSGVLHNPDYTMELLFQTVYQLRTVHHFQGYIHLKAIPGASQEIIDRVGYYVDRMSVNLELPTADGLKKLAPHKSRHTILKPMKQIQLRAKENKQELALYKGGQKFVPAGQSTQMIVGATGESDLHLVRVAQSLYDQFELKRVFYSAFVNVNEDSDLPATESGPPLLREHRLYQADWLMRFYGFKGNELLSEQKPNFNSMLDPKCDWAIANLEQFPVEVETADYYTLLRVPGIGPTSAWRIVGARKHSKLSFELLKKIGVVLKRALYFITCHGKMLYPTKLDADYILRNMLDPREKLPVDPRGITYQQLSLFDCGLDSSTQSLEQPLSLIV